MAARSSRGFASVAVAASGLVLAAAGVAPAVAATHSPAAPTVGGYSTCNAANLKAFGGTSSGAAGSITVQFGFRNKGSRGCSLKGYPQLQMQSAGGGDISTTDGHAPRGSDDIHRSKVDLAPGSRAYFAVSYEDQTGYGTLMCPTSHSLALRAPHVDGTNELRGKRAHIQPYGGTVQHLECGRVSISPVSKKPVIN